MGHRPHFHVTTNIEMLTNYQCIFCILKFNSKTLFTELQTV